MINMKNHGIKAKCLSHRIILFFGELEAPASVSLPSRMVAPANVSMGLIICQALTQSSQQSNGEKTVNFPHLIPEKIER